MKRSLENWENMVPVAVCEGSAAQVLFCIQDARHDILELSKEIDRLNKWADGFSDAQLKERATGEEYQRELRAEIEHLHKALEAHGKHEPDCWQWLKDSSDPDTRCTCALGEVLSSDLIHSSDRQENITNSSNDPKSN